MEEADIAIFARFSKFANGIDGIRGSVRADETFREHNCLRKCSGKHLGRSELTWCIVAPLSKGLELIAESECRAGARGDGPYKPKCQNASEDRWP